MVRQSERATEVLAQISAGTRTTRRDIIRMISSMEEQVKQEEEEEQMSIVPSGASTRTGGISPWQALCQCRLSSGMRLAIALGFWQQITGTEAVLYYSADFLQNAGLESPTERLLGNCFVGLCKLTPELIAMHWVDSLGRRPLMLASAGTLFLSTCLISSAFYFHWSPLTVVIFLCSIMASFSIGIGPFTFLVASESLGLSERATGMTLCAATNRITSGSVALTAVSMYQALGSSGLFAVYAVVGFLSLPFYFTTIPETAGKTLEEIASARHNATYVTPNHELETGNTVRPSSTLDGQYDDTVASSSDDGDNKSPQKVV
jgi:hypothetical protein